MLILVKRLYKLIVQVSQDAELFELVKVHLELGCVLVTLGKRLHVHYSGLL